MRPTKISTLLSISMLLTMNSASSLAQNVTIHTADSLPRLSGESRQEHEARRRGLTYGTQENVAYCQDQAISIGRCKSRPNKSCYIHEAYFRSACVAPGGDSEAAIQAIPALDPEIYFDKRDGVWISRAQYCEWLRTSSVSRRGLQARIRTYNRNCSNN